MVRVLEGLYCYEEVMMHLYPGFSRICAIYAKLDDSVQNVVLASAVPTQLSSINTIRQRDHCLFIPEESRKEGKVAKTIDSLRKDTSAQPPFLFVQNGRLEDKLRGMTNTAQAARLPIPSNAECTT